MLNCKKICYLDLSKLSKITNIGKYFLNNCENLRELKFITIEKVKVGKKFLSNCKKLIHVY